MDVHAVIRALVAAVGIALATQAHAIEFDGIPASGDTLGPPSHLMPPGCKGLQTGVDGLVTCTDLPGPSEFAGAAMLAGGSLRPFAVVAMGTNPGTVVEATASAPTRVIGCVQSATSKAAGQPVTVAYAGRMKCAADSGVSAGALLKLSAGGGKFETGDLWDPSWGIALENFDGVGAVDTLLFPAPSTLVNAVIYGQLVLEGGAAQDGNETVILPATPNGRAVLLIPAPAGGFDTFALLNEAQTLANKTLNGAVISGSTNPTPTAEGRIEWDTDDDCLVVGTGSGTKRFCLDS